MSTSSVTLRARGTRVRQRTPSRPSRVAKPATVLADAVTVTLALTLARVVVMSSEGLRVAPGDTRMLPFIVVVWLVVVSRFDLYSARHVGSRIREARGVLNATAVSIVIMGFLGLVAGVHLARGWLLTSFVLAVPMLLVEREVVRRSFTALRRRGHLLRPVAVIGTNDEAYELREMLETNRSLGYRVTGLLPSGGEVSDLLASVMASGARGVVVATTAASHETINRLVRDLVEAGIHVELSSSLRDIAPERLVVRPLGRHPMLYVEPVRRGGWRGVAKRTFDVGFAALVLTLASVFLVLIAIAIRASSPGPALFRQTRVGRDGVPFQVLKLRTMARDAEERLNTLAHLNEADGPLFKLHDDPRVTPLGRVLRAYSIDEIPQLWNVLRGEMSVVGPRPALPSEASGWTDEMRGRLRVRPGLTGMWQVSGRSDASFADYVRLDLYYVDNWSLLTDVAMVVQTIPTVLFRKGAY